tara:strand:- start:521 stop:700 length:180 start_codon:yes stop_codon:yes gene_type:complete
VSSRGLGGGFRVRLGLVPSLVQFVDEPLVQVLHRADGVFGGFELLFRVFRGFFVGLELG